VILLCLRPSVFYSRRSVLCYNGRMKIIGINDIVELNKELKADGLDYKIHLQDSCGAQTCRIERLESGGCEDQDEALKKKLKAFFRRRGMEIAYSHDEEYFWATS
jgi:hypothetical protein